MTNDEYVLYDKSRKIVAMGTESQMFSYVKHHVPDGRYRIEGPTLVLDCDRKDGIVGPCPDGVCLEKEEVQMTAEELLDKLI
jgi:hypothetical protein